MKYPRYPEYRASGVDWLGEVPVHWGVKRLKYAVELAGEKVDEMPDDGRYVALEHIESWTGRQIDGDVELKPESQTNRFREGDVLFGKLRPYLAKVWRASFDGYSSGELLVLRQRELLPDFAKYFCLTRGFVDLVDSSTYGSKMPRANWDFIGNQLAVIPPLDEQQAIAGFLDRETARIDALIATKRRFIALLQEKRAALISRAVARGLDPDAPLKDSGVEWMGSISNAWMLTRIGILCEVGNGSTPSREEPLYWDGGIHPWLNSSAVNRGVVEYADQFVTDLALKECHLPSVRPLSILVALTGEGKTRGRAALLTFEATINQHLAYVTPRDRRIEPRFLRWWLHAHRSALRMLSDSEGGTKGAITCELLKSFPAPLLPREEQLEIARALDAHDARFQEAVRLADSAIATLVELRTTLIASAVTGKFDTRTAA